MKIFSKEFERIKNKQAKPIPKDFTYNAYSYLFLGVFLIAGAALQYLLTPAGPMGILMIAGNFLGMAVILTLLPLWGMVIFLLTVFWLYSLAGYPHPLELDFELTAETSRILTAAGTLGILFSSALQVVYHWDKVVILRLGRFRKVHGPGLFFLFPLIDRVAAFIDTRIRATDFSAEKTLTKDTVPVHVDALAFWMIWDPQKAVLEVENFIEAVILSAQTALRDSIGRHDLATLLSKREELGREIQEVLDAKTNPWGITILSVEFTDIVIPRELEDSMSKQAQAERERQSRVILAGAEVEIAQKFEEAAEIYKENPTAMQLRAMNMVYEGIRQKGGSLMVLPSSALDNMNLGGMMGTAALNKINNTEKQKETEQEEK